MAWLPSRREIFVCPGLLAKNSLAHRSGLPHSLPPLYTVFRVRARRAALVLCVREPEIIFIRLVFLVFTLQAPHHSCMDVSSVCSPRTEEFTGSTEINCARAFAAAGINLDISLRLKPGK